jgi:hypothetical protein
MRRSSHADGTEDARDAARDQDLGGTEPARWTGRCSPAHGPEGVPDATREYDLDGTGYREVNETQRPLEWSRGCRPRRPESHDLAGARTREATET